jgi:hypothetical protein
MVIGSAEHAVRVVECDHAQGRSGSGIDLRRATAGRKLGKRVRGVDSTTRSGQQRSRVSSGHSTTGPMLGEREVETRGDVNQCTCSNKEGSPTNDYPPGGLARTSSSSTGRRWNRRRGSVMHMQYMRKARSLSSRAVLPAHVAPNDEGG